MFHHCRQIVELRPSLEDQLITQCSGWIFPHHCWICWHRYSLFPARHILNRLIRLAPSSLSITVLREVSLEASPSFLACKLVRSSCRPSKACDFGLPDKPAGKTKHQPRDQCEKAKTARAPFFLIDKGVTAGHLRNAQYADQASNWD